MKAFLTQRGIGCDIYYPVPLHLQECFAHLRQSRGSLPVAESLADQCLSIPIFPELSPEQQDEVIAAIADYLQGRDPTGC